MQSDPMTLTLFAPLFGAILAFLFPRAARALGLVAVLVTGGAVVWLARAVLAEGAVTLALGGWAPPLGISLRADGLSVAMLAMTAAVGLLVSLGALDALRDARQTRYFWPLWLLLLTGMNGVYLSTDIFNLYVMIEVIALAAVGLTVLSGTRAALRAGLEYMYASILGALLFLMGVGFVYLQLGRLDFAGLITAEPSGALSAALALMVVGLALKTALFPLHFWLPAAHANATAPASALLSGLVVKAALYIFLRLTTYMPLPDEVLVTLIGTLGAGAVIWGGIQALRAERLKLLVAWSTVVQIGLIFIAFARAGQVGLTESWKAAALLILAHGVAKAAMFLAAGIYIAAIGSDRLGDMRGLARALPMTGFAFALASITLLGLPPSAGFTAKYLMMTAAFASGQWAWALVLAGGGLLAAAYLYRPLSAIFARDTALTPRPIPWAWQAVPLVLAALSVALGLLSSIPFEFLQIGRPEQAAEGL